MKLILAALVAATTLITAAPAEANRGRACARILPCEQAVSGRDLRMCLAYVEKRGCNVLTGEDKGWCQVIMEGGSCYGVGLGHGVDDCEEGQYPGSHLYWKKCGES